MRKKANTGLIVLALGGAAFLYWKYLYIGEGDMHAGRNYLTNRGLPASDQDVKNLFKQYGKSYVINNQVPGGGMQPIITTPGTIITTYPTYNPPPLDVTGIVDSLFNNPDNSWAEWDMV